MEEKIGDMFISALADALAERIIKEMKEEKLKRNDKEKDKKDFIAKGEAMKKYSFTNSTAYRWQKLGILKVYRLGRKVWYRESGIEKALESKWHA